MGFLDLRDIGVEFESNGKKLQALSNISFSVDTNQFVSIIGPSGSGKSTIIKILLNWGRYTKLFTYDSDIGNIVLND